MQIDALDRSDESIFQQGRFYRFDNITIDVKTLEALQEKESAFYTGCEYCLRSNRNGCRCPYPRYMDCYREPIYIRGNRTEICSTAFNAVAQRFVGYTAEETISMTNDDFQKSIYEPLLSRIQHNRFNVVLCFEKGSLIVAQIEEFYPGLRLVNSSVS